MAMEFLKRLVVASGAKVRLADIDPRETFGLADKQGAEALRAANVAKLADLSDLLWADGRYSLLIVLQGMDTSGKDGTIRRVMSGINPRDCHVVSFKRPTDDELGHDFLWRVHKECPRRGVVGVFNRSHYEDVLTVRVHELVPKNVWQGRYDQINAFEKILVENGTRVLKFFLHISKDEQKKRLEERIKDPTKNWKMELGDLDERKRWDGYQRAYEDAISNCSTAAAPWIVVPADRKWFRDVAVSSIVVETLEGMGLTYPTPKFDPSKVKFE